MNRLIASRVLAAVLVLAWAGAHGSATVEYRGDLLIVEGVEYRPEAARRHAKGSVLVVAAEGQLEVAEASAVRLGLRIKERLSLAHSFALEVPVGYETQWVAALRQQPGVQFVGVNSIMYGEPAKIERGVSAP
jgi:hypothetical protein